MKDRIEALFTDLDQSLFANAGGKVLKLYVIGRASLVWQYDYPATNRDIDVLITGQPEGLIRRAVEPKDRADIRLLCDQDLLDPCQLEQRLESAYQFSLQKDGDPLRDAAFAHLAIVQGYLRGELAEF